MQWHRISAFRLCTLAVKPESSFCITMYDSSEYGAFYRPEQWLFPLLLVMLVVAIAVFIIGDHSFPWNMEFWAKLQNLPVSVEFLHFHGILQNPVLTGDKYVVSVNYYVWKIFHSELRNLANWLAESAKFAAENCGPFLSSLYIRLITGWQTVVTQTINLLCAVNAVSVMRIS